LEPLLCASQGFCSSHLGLQQADQRWDEISAKMIKGLIFFPVSWQEIPAHNENTEKF
jgi:hypothetical protein